MSVLDFMYEHCCECGTRVKEFPDKSTESVVIVREIEDREFFGFSFSWNQSDYFCKDCSEVKDN